MSDLEKFMRETVYADNESLRAQITTLTNALEVANRDRDALWVALNNALNSEVVKQAPFSGYSEALANAQMVLKKTNRLESPTTQSEGERDG